MYTRIGAALLLSTGLTAGAALAQSTAPAATAPGTTTTSGAPSSGSFVTDQGTGEFRASKFVGLDVYGSDNEKIGDISEILIDGQGNARAVVIGVGGFLGIGQKSVAVPWSALTWSNDRLPSRSATTGATPVGGAPVSTGSTTPALAPTAPARSPAEQAAYNGYPDHATVTLSKAQLQDAPAFKYYSDTHSSSGSQPNASPPASRP